MAREVSGFNQAMNAQQRQAPARPDPREDDPRGRAARRAAEIRGHLGDLDAGTDDFYIDPTAIPDGWSYEWKRKSIFNMEDPTYAVQIAQRGWTPVPVSRHPEWMPMNWSHQTIERKGLILMERPQEITDEARLAEIRKARGQVRAKEEQLSASPSGQFERSNKDSSLVKVKKSYEAMPIPED